MAQTLTEIDYETVIDDEDVVDEFLLFKNTLHCETAVYILIIAFCDTDSTPSAPNKVYLSSIRNTGLFPA